MRKVIIKDQREQVEILFHSNAVEIRFYRVGKVVVEILQDPTASIAFESLKAIDKTQEFEFRAQEFVIRGYYNPDDEFEYSLDSSFWGSSLELIDE